VKDAERRARLIQLWLLRPPGKRTENDVLAFYGELERTRPKLLSRAHGDPYQQLKVDLRDYIER
jgi:hypothetical protein